jgi:predicted GIY-YIG superfamily endonuclease
MRCTRDGPNKVSIDTMQYFFVYILRCADGSYYVGHTDNLEQRIAEHRHAVYPCYTSSRLPIEVVFQQEFESRISALEAERKIKNWSRKKKEAFIDGDSESFALYSKKKF